MSAGSKICHLLLQVPSRFHRHIADRASGSAAKLGEPDLPVRFSIQERSDGMDSRVGSGTVIGTLRPAFKAAILVANFSAACCRGA